MAQRKNPRPDYRKINRLSLFNRAYRKMLLQVEEDLWGEPQPRYSYVPLSSALLNFEFTLSPAAPPSQIEDLLPYPPTR